MPTFTALTTLEGRSAAEKLGEALEALEPAPPLELGVPAYFVFTRPYRLELYDLSEDPGETRDLAAAHPEIVTELHA